MWGFLFPFECFTAPLIFPWLQRLKFDTRKLQVWILTLNTMAEPPAQLSQFSQKPDHCSLQSHSQGHVKESSTHSYTAYHPHMNITKQLKAWHMYRSWCFNWHNIQKEKKMKVRKSSYCSINILFTNFHIVQHEYSPLSISEYTSNQNPQPVHLPQTYLPNSHLNIKQHPHHSFQCLPSSYTFVQMDLNGLLCWAVHAPCHSS